MKKFLLLSAALFAMAASAQTVTYQTSFDNDDELAGWLNVDSDGDGHTFFVFPNNGENIYSHSGDQCVGSESYDNETYKALTPDNWLISPTIKVGVQAKAEFYVAAQDGSYYADVYGVFISENTNETTLNTGDFVQLKKGTAPESGWEQVVVDLSAYQGKDVRIAIRHYDCSDFFIIKFDDFRVTEESTAISTVNAETGVSNEWYDLNGRKLNGRPSASGLYLNGGRKVVVK